ncbi:MAG: UDP-N-acetylmuramoyl-tripeptide--D-alanyl-D-alanine ligase [Phycisphaerae bacterium]
MIPLGLQEICQAVKGTWRGASAGAACPPKSQLTFTAVSTDTRSAKAGGLFVTLRGKQFDAHAFLDTAAAAGCAAAIVCRDGKMADGIAGKFPGGLIVVADTTQALADLAAWHRGQVRAKVVAVTGSNGKTTVKLMIHHILSASLKGTASPKSFNNEIGVPLTLLGVSADDDYVVCEVGTNAPGEIDALSRIAQPDVAVITSVAKTHLEKLGSIEQVATEKATLLRHLREGGPAIVWGDSEVLDKALKRYNPRWVLFGVSDGCDYRLTGFESSGRSQRFEVNGRLWVDMPQPGRHNAINALGALAVAMHMGIPLKEAGARLASFSGAAMRLEWIEAGGVTLINDAYNANPASVIAAADVLADLPATRKVMIVGDMRELGDLAQMLHLETGSQIASRVDLLIGVGELGRYIAMGATEAGIEARAYDNVAKAIPEVLALLRRGDAVLIKGSRAMGMEQLIEPIRSALKT